MRGGGLILCDACDTWIRDQVEAAHHSKEEAARHSKEIEF
jgi:hypothetical protein